MNLQRWKSPVFSETSGSYFETTEISTMISLLKIIDNPRQNIQMLATMYSSLFNFSVDELVEIKTASNEKMIVDSINKFIEISLNVELTSKLTLFMECLNKWRGLAEYCEISSLIWTIYSQTDFINKMKTLQAGGKRASNLMAFFEHAITFEKNNSKALLLSILRSYKRIRLILVTQK